MIHDVPCARGTHRFLAGFDGDQLLDIQQIELDRAPQYSSLSSGTIRRQALRETMLAAIEKNKAKQALLHSDLMALIEAVYAVDHGRDASLDDTGDPVD